MRFRQLGNSGLTVSEVGLGCNNFGVRCDLETSRSVVDRAIELGITFFDTADIYGNLGGSETFLGEILGPRRDSIILATKFGMSMETGDIARGSRRYINKAFEASLRRLKTDYIDLYQIHEPDPNTPLEETMAALDELVKQGKVRYVGSSNFAGWQIASSDHIARERNYERFISAQNHYSLLHRKVEDEVIPAAKAFGVGILPYFPLASGLLTGKFKRGAEAQKGTRLASRPGEFARANFDLIEELESCASQFEMELIDLAFGWLLANEAVSSVIAGATSPKQVERNVNTNKIILSKSQYDEVATILAKYSN
ncbi:aldo/keto reductase [Acidithrix ferrooxidans]|uniref:L-glyceraldehyde 3-phosphate reductase n=1 Tax=Acidithrix ferrooxidans TaxID=1280514 RepID=A0A0D8HKI9_9ACTN|nr:aldo/keto reductase [Acidithrix ferrooxidans]KJF18428.1 L-glyceraldehyde 3-phosphate reductase [Acidithrix ferrooxidans]